MIRRALLFLILFSMFIVGTACGWDGKVVGVSDGDTITVMHDGRGEKIRLYGVDCPESHQDYGTRAKQFTSDQVFGRVVSVSPVDTDRYGRTVGKVSIQNTSLNEALVSNGLAWVYTRYCTASECSDWKKAEQRARESRIGLWSMPSPIAPWDFRRGAR